MQKSAGITLFRRKNVDIEYFLVHPGGPYWKGKEKGAWSIPKGEFSNEDPLEAAKREFLEETGQVVNGEFMALDPVTLKSGKLIYAWALEGDADETNFISNVFEMEWPPRSGRSIKVPEVDKAGWFFIEEARELLNAAQVSFILQVKEKLHKP